MKGHLHELALFIFSVCTKTCISIDIQWIPRKLNAKSDAISKIFDYDDWEVSLDFFKFVDGLFGPHSFDRFANSETFKINKLNSKFSTPGTSGVDAFAFNWAGENNWQVPPLNIVNKVNNKITELRTILQIRAITKLPNSEQSNKGKVKTHKYINRQNQSTTGKL
jgi:hypothetical protein